MLMKPLLTAQGPLQKRGTCKILRAGHREVMERLGLLVDPRAGPRQSSLLPLRCPWNVVLPTMHTVGAMASIHTFQILVGGRHQDLLILSCPDKPQMQVPLLMKAAAHPCGAACPFLQLPPALGKEGPPRKPPRFHPTDFLR